MRHKLPTQLRTLSSLFANREQRLVDLVNELTFADVRDEAAVERSYDHISDQVVLSPVTFKDPDLVSDRVQKRQSSGDFTNPTPHTKQMVIATVAYSFTGSVELFGCSPNNAQFEGTRFYQPDFSPLSVDVELSSLDRDTAFNRARESLRDTFNLIKQVNTQAIEWSIAIEPKIRAAIQRRREAVLNAYQK